MNITLFYEREEISVSFLEFWVFNIEVLCGF